MKTCELILTIRVRKLEIERKKSSLWRAIAVSKSPLSTLVESSRGLIASCDNRF